MLFSPKNRFAENEVFRNGELGVGRNIFDNGDGNAGGFGGGDIVCYKNIFVINFLIRGENFFERKYLRGFRFPEPRPIKVFRAACRFRRRVGGNAFDGIFAAMREHGTAFALCDVGEFEQVFCGNQRAGAIVDKSERSRRIPVRACGGSKPV